MPAEVGESGLMPAALGSCQESKEVAVAEGVAPPPAEAAAEAAATAEAPLCW